MKNKTNVLVIDDENNICELLKDILDDEGYCTFTANNGNSGLKLLEIYPIMVVFLDVWLPDGSGLDFLQNIKKLYPNIEVIIISGHASIDNAVFAMKSGAFDVLEKPLSLDRVVTLTANALKMSQDKDNEGYIRQEDKMIGSSHLMAKVRENIAIASKSEVTVFIEGENGSGKDLVAKEIHRLSNRSKNPFVAINCAAIPEQLIESELFGYKKGAFTGAMTDKKGKFEIANNGTLFLDEIADLSLPAQAKILSAIENKKIAVIGTSREVQLDIRLICATNKNMNLQIQGGNFRQDLYYRLYVFPIKCPSLEERKEDIIQIAGYFLEQFSSKYSKKLSLCDDAKVELQNHKWAGNVRELKNFTERLAVLYDGDIKLEQVRSCLNINSSSQSSAQNQNGNHSNLSIKEAKDEFEKQAILKALKDNDYNLSKTAKSLGMYPSNLTLKMKKFDINV